MKLVDKITHIGDNFSVSFYDNGYMIEVGGKDDSGHWKTAKVVCKSTDELLVLIAEALELPRDE